MPKPLSARAAALFAVLGHPTNPNLLLVDKDVDGTLVFERGRARVGTIQYDPLTTMPWTGLQQYVALVVESRRHSWAHHLITAPTVDALIKKSDSLLLTFGDADRSGVSVVFDLDTGEKCAVKVTRAVTTAITRRSKVRRKVAAVA